MGKKIFNQALLDKINNDTYTLEDISAVRGDYKGVLVAKYLQRNAAKERVRTSMTEEDMNTINNKINQIVEENKEVEEPIVEVKAEEPREEQNDGEQHTDVE